MLSNEKLKAFADNPALGPIYSSMARELLELKKTVSHERDVFDKNAAILSDRVEYLYRRLAAAERVVEAVMDMRLADAITAAKTYKEKTNANG